MVVDGNNQPIGGVTRSELRQNLSKYWHRASYVYIVTDSSHGKKLLVQKRSVKKDYCPGYFDLCTGGVVGEGEDDDVSAEREVEEELGVAGLTLEKIKVIKQADAGVRNFANVYLVREFNPAKTPLKLQEDEVEEIQYWSHEHIKSLIKAGNTQNITKDSIDVYEDLVRNKIF